MIVTAENRRTGVKTYSSASLSTRNSAFRAVLCGQMTRKRPDQPTNQQTNQPTTQLTKRSEGADLSEGVSRRPSVCLDISACTASLGSVTGTLNYNWIALMLTSSRRVWRRRHVGKLRTSAQETIGLIRVKRHEPLNDPLICFFSPSVSLYLLLQLSISFYLNINFHDCSGNYVLKTGPLGCDDF
jgi:hypothetical protein